MSKKTPKRSWPLILCLTLMLSGATGNDAPNSRTVEHSLSVLHPGNPLARPETCTLVQNLDAAGEPRSYSMWVDSVICRETTCDVVKVQLHWDVLGRYQHYNLAIDSTLTKLDHEPFTEKDYAKLQRILSDAASPLNEVEKEAMTGEAKKRSDDAALDGVSGATILTLKNAVIIGAGYTCYDLWHWANGALTARIRHFTGTRCSVSALRTRLASEDRLSSTFAIDYLSRRNVGDSATTAAVLTRALNGGDELILPAMDYLKAVHDGGVYRTSLLAMFEKASIQQRVIILQALLKEKPGIAPDLLESLCRHLPSLETFYEVQLFFRLCEKQNIPPAVVVAPSVELLSHERFFVQRRALEYLDSQTLPADLQSTIEAYRLQNRDRL
ncbi:MAG: hypothetical protein ACI9OU_000690 [Candidatus Promineifilaceae bacterium]|jgi:hypothetical protein